MSESESVILTQSAAEKIFLLMAEEDNFALKLRVYVTGGGCSGFQYGFAFEEQVEVDDMIVMRSVACKKLNNEMPEENDNEEDEDDGEGDGDFSVALLIDPISLQYLSGAEIDYREDIEGSQFIIRNPNAKTTCGCGSSFST